MTFDKNDEKLQLLWSDPGVFDALVFEIARLVVAQFPDIKFRICVNYYEARFAQAEKGILKWLELNREEQQRMLDEVCDSIININGDCDDLPF